ncbi:SRPBCC family protein [Mycolicibacterium monacense]|uniref:Activator of HSP90 ATPase n=4 Tax=Mycobacteriaceae TaxID=1762 RepID=A0AAD1J0F8_MYCMB|nr:SRPBCC domain-containing protein [Mycolicibacterium monacense]OBB56234.1 polyketide cyclase [Mycolicibacterium monacense]OBF56564.1 polyketide cyclase [Mycolicibacterium monacense]ORB21178.1 polyketide cyclase [Mycolicibacterium monacense DSM 44395]QHP89034.1 SRPBCC domain-containing protein [Mycolicibacterium monacense DSM 44395]BBZ63493.1 activator of HSP90 ATPase [Mycolicibacterium monacense]
MPVTEFNTNIDDLTLTITAEFAAPVERVWQIYADPRQLEKIWGPPDYPATVVDHSLTPGGIVTYFMTGPDGDKYPGYWKVIAVDEPRSFSFEDGFADDDLKPASDMPVAHSVYTFEPAGDGRTIATYVSRYASAEGLQKVLEMGVEEGSTQAINQIDAFLAG